MTNVEDMMGESWDLGEVLAERAQPKDSVSVYLNEAASYAKSQLIKTQVGLDAEALEKVNQELEKIEADLESTKYTIHITAIPSRMREDLNSKALHKFPIKPNILGQDDFENARERQKYGQDLIWHAQVFDVVNPLGKHKSDWSFEQMQEFAKALPTNAQQAIDKKIEEVTKAAEEFTVASKNANFS